MEELLHPCSGWWWALSAPGFVVRSSFSALLLSLVLTLYSSLLSLPLVVGYSEFKRLQTGCEAVEKWLWSEDCCAWTLTHHSGGFKYEALELLAPLLV